MKKLPPYGAKILPRVQRKEITNDIYLFAGVNAWAKANNFIISKPTLCLPPFLDPSEFAWPVNNMPVLIFDTGCFEDAYLDKLAYCLYLDGATGIRLVHCDGAVKVYQREVANG